MTVFALQLLLVIFALATLVQGQDGVPCGNTWCLCFYRNKTALCRGHGRKLTYIPRLPTYVKHLDFTRNFLPNVSTETFKSIDALQLKTMKLEFNKITYITQSAFSTFNNLSGLSLDGNKIPENILQIAFNSITRSPLSYLSLKWFDMKSRDILATLHFKRLHILLLDSNEFLYYDQSDYLHFPNLRVLSLRHNGIKSVSLKFSPSLRELNLMDNKIQDMPDFCIGNMSYFPNLQKISLNHNLISEIKKEKIICLSKLVALSLDSNFISEVKENTFYDLKSLKYLYLENLKTLQTIEKHAFSSTSIKTITLVYSVVIFKNKVHPDAFRGCTGITSLDLNGNMFQSSSSEDLKNWFGHLTSLTDFALGKCDLESYPDFIPQNLINIQQLSLHDNNIVELPLDAFIPLRNLTTLSLAGNHIAKIDERVFPLDLKQRLKTINLAHNPFACNCELLWFLNWIKQDFHKFEESPNNYVCASPVTMFNKSLMNVYLSKQTCYLSIFTSLVIIGCSSFLLLIILTVSILYRQRWHIRYYLYLRRHRQGNFRRIDNQRIDYDAYVIYSIDDIQWIKNELIRNLEEVGLKLYIRDRDSMAGLPIVDNVVNNMTVSRHVLVVLSNAMAKDEQCQFELMYVQRQEEGQRSPIILVLLEEVQAANVTQSVYALVQMNSYISWGEERNARDLFWNRLKYSLNAGREENGEIE